MYMYLISLFSSPVMIILLIVLIVMRLLYVYVPYKDSEDRHDKMWIGGLTTAIMCIAIIFITIVLGTYNKF